MIEIILLTRQQAQEFRKQELEVMTGGLKTFTQEERLNDQLRYFKTTKMPFYIHHLNQTGLFVGISV